MDEILNGFLVAARENEAESLNENTQMVCLLEKMTAALRDAAGLNPDLTRKGLNPLEAILLANAHSLFLAAVRVALSGQSPPVFAILRASLESALYAVIAAQGAENRQLWYHRSGKIKECRKVYNKETVTKYLKSVDPNLADLVAQHYGWSIELGAHPNVKSVAHHLSFNDQRDDGNTAVTLAILHNAGSGKILQTLAACFEVGSCILYLGPHALPDYEPAGTGHGLSTALTVEFHSLMQPFMPPEWLASSQQ
jgi:hypothetical protein